MFDLKQLPGTKVGEYKVLAKVGVGGMGVVFEGLQPLIGKRVAIKVLLPQYSAQQELVDRFLSEARAVNAIRHRGIVDIFSFGQLPDGAHYLVMEFLEGEPFDKLIRRKGPLPVVEVLGWLEEVLDALDAAHGKGIIHRDIKPSNLFLVSSYRSKPYVKLLDFGIAKLGAVEGGDTPQTRASVIVGTPDYLSPEQARGDAIGAYTDLYSLGVVAFELLTGKRPFQGHNAMATMWLHVEGPIPKASSLNPTLPPEIDDLIMWAMAKSPVERPASAAIMRDRVEGLRRRLATSNTIVLPPTQPTIPPRAPVDVKPIETVEAVESTDPANSDPGLNVSTPAPEAPSQRAHDMEPTIQGSAFDLDDLQSVATRVKPNKPKVPAAEPKAATAGSTETLTTVPEDEETRLKADQSKRKSNAPVVALVAILVSCVAVASLLLSRCH